jgi:hypothetical protein
MILEMILTQMARVCREELFRARRGIGRAYEMVRELDKRTLEVLLILLGIR